jgi:hypothetical protein
MRIAEFKIDNPHDKLLPYEEAKNEALKKLRDHVAPYLARIEELERDEFAKTGALPPLRAWRYDYRHTVVTAKTKKRARELANESRYGFETGWDECGGDWWYHLAQEEAIWIEELDDKKQGTGVYYRPVGQEEAEQILEPYLSPYRTMDIYELLGKVGHTSTTTGVNSLGTPYRVTTRIWESGWGKKRVQVTAEIEGCRGWYGRHSLDVERELPEPVVVGTEEWAKEGF